MPYLPHAKILFIHIPKTGGKSVTKVLFPNGRNPDRLKYLEGPYKGNDPELEGEHLSHLTWKQIVYVIGQEKFDEAHKFAFVRNPYDRLVSNYFYLQQKYSNRKHPMLEDTHNSSFKDFVYQLEKTLPNIYDYDKWGREHFMLQAEFICDGDRLLIDELGRFENYQDDFKRIVKTGNIPWINKTSHTKWQDYYTDELRKIVYKLYQKDFEILDYKE